MNVALDIVAPIAWSLAGFVVGFLFARMSKDVHEIKEAAVGEETYDGPERRKNPPTNVNRLLGVLLVLLSIATVTLLAVSNSQQRAIVDCQSNVNHRMVETINTRALAAAKDKKALDDMLAVVLTLKTPEQRRAAVEHYVEVARQTAEERARTPYPTPNEFDCKEAR